MTSFLGCTRYNSYRLPSVRSKWSMAITTPLLNRFNNILKKKHPHLAKKKVLFHQDNAWVHTCPALIAKFNEFRYELLPHPAYSLDLAPCDYFLFPNLKKWFGGKRFITKEQLITETGLILKSWINHIIRMAWKSWKIVGSSIELKGDYVEK